jgi:hypothetical protein
VGKNNDAQARYYREQLLAASRQRKEQLAQRAVTIGILRNMAAVDDDPELADLARWVEAGGNPQFGLSYGLARDKANAARNQAVRILEKMSEQEDDSELYELALWVRAGGDQKFTLDYALKPRRAEEKGRPPAADSSRAHSLWSSTRQLR